MNAFQPAWFVFHELGDSGWAAYVHGRRRPLHRADVLFHAVRLEPGDRQVVVDYASWRAVAATFVP